MVEVLDGDHLAGSLVLDVLHRVLDVADNLLARVVFQVFDEEAVLHLVLILRLPVLAVGPALLQGARRLVVVLGHVQLVDWILGVQLLQHLFVAPFHAHRGPVPRLVAVVGLVLGLLPQRLNFLLVADASVGPGGLVEATSRLADVAPLVFLELLQLGLQQLVLFPLLPPDHLRILE